MNLSYIYLSLSHQRNRDLSTPSESTDARGFVYSPFNVNIPTSIMSDSKKNKTSKQRGTKRTLYIDKEVYEKAKEDAEEQDRSVSYIVNAILKKYYKLTKKDKSQE